MKLSDAIRLGAMLQPQGFGRFRTDEGTCALGAAMDALGGAVSLDQILPTQPMLKQRVRCPVADCIGWNVWLLNVIAHLNDDHRWTREQIADYVASLEAESEPAVSLAAPSREAAPEEQGV